MRLIDRLDVRPLLDGVRGAPPANARSLALAMSRLSSLAWDLGDLICALDINPLIVSPNGCVAVDALVEPLSENTPDATEMSAPRRPQRARGSERSTLLPTPVEGTLGRAPVGYLRDPALQIPPCDHAHELAHRQFLG